MIFLSQTGKIPHEMLCSSIELFGREVLPEFKEREEKRARERTPIRERINEKAMA